MNAFARWLTRLSLLFILVLAGLGGLEGYARLRHLDRRTARAIAVSGQPSSASDFQLLPLAYLPRVYTLTDQALTTAWGTCRFDHVGRTILVLGDSTTRQTSSDVAERSWAGLVAQTLPDDVQICVVAEDGYHPVDYAVLYAKLAPLLHPDLLVTMLCNNDLYDIASRIAVAENGWTVVYEQPSTTPVYPPLWQPWLWNHSEAYRFVNWRLAELTGDSVELPVSGRRLSYRSALKTLIDSDIPVVIAYLPPISEQVAQDIPTAMALAWLKARHPVLHLDLQPPIEPLRRTPSDDVHLSDLGHQRVAKQLGPAILNALAKIPRHQP
ncbi:MAG: hypothetical protein GXP62_03100 [Oligoflexia bacterium]|nr:hypothetical protein [Oligoflexia bacterium]